MRKRWVAHVKAHAPGMVKSNRDAFVHELIHAIDSERIPPEARTKHLRASQPAAGANYTKYYNDPLETNAFIQQGMSKMVDQLRNVSTPQGRRLVMGGTSQEFFQNLLKRMDQNFVKHLTPDNRRKLAKRAAQLYGELVSQ